MGTRGAAVLRFREAARDLKGEEGPHPVVREQPFGELTAVLVRVLAEGGGVEIGEDQVDPGRVRLQPRRAARGLEL